MPERVAADAKVTVSDALTTRVIRDEAQFAALGERWEAVCRDSAADHVFWSWEWVEAWWRAFGRGKELAVAVAERDGDLVGIAPLYRASPAPGGGARVLRWIGTGESVSPDHLTFIVRRAHEAEATLALLEALLPRGARSVLDLTDVPEDAPLACLLAGAGARGFCWAAHRWAVCPYAALPDSWQAYEGRLNRKTRYNMRREARRLLTEQGALPATWHTEDACLAGLEEVARLHRLRFEGRAEQHSFSDEGYMAFHREFVRRAARQGWLRLYGLRVGGQVIAAWYGFRRGDVLYHYQGGFDPAWEPFSPGTVLQGLVVREAIETGARELDLLKGDYAYKRLWATGERRTLRLRAARRSVSGYAALAPAWLESGKDHLKGMLVRRRWGRHRPPVAAESQADVTTAR